MSVEKRELSLETCGKTRGGDSHLSRRVATSHLRGGDYHNRHSVHLLSDERSSHLTPASEHTSSTMRRLLIACVLPTALLALPLAPARAPPIFVSRRASITGGCAFLIASNRPSPVDAASDNGGIEIEVLKRGDSSSPLPQRAQKAVVDYTLWIDGFERKQIDSSKGSAFPPKIPSPFTFNVGVGEVIPGWDKTVRTMHVGDKLRCIIPPELGYGAKGVGPIPGGAKLYFEIELLELKPMPQLTDKQLEWLETHPEP